MADLEKILDKERDGKIQRISSWKVLDDPKMRYFSELETDEGLWLIDPVNGEKLQQEIEDDDLQGILVIHDRHWRDSVKIANRNQVPIYVPNFFSEVPENAEQVKYFDQIPELELQYSKVIDKSFWQEAILYNDNMIISGDSLGTSPAMGSKELYLNPIMRIFRPKNVFEGLKPQIILVGHGEPVTENASKLLSEALEQSRTSGVIDLGRFVFKMIK